MSTEMQVTLPGVALPGVALPGVALPGGLCETAIGKARFVRPLPPEVFDPNPEYEAVAEAGPENGAMYRVFTDTGIAAGINGEIGDEYIVRRNISDAEAGEMISRLKRELQLTAK